jgi:putative transcription antitermination factor YqgF
MKEEVRKNYLGIDWGATDVGVALAHAETGVSLAYATLHNDEHLLEQLLGIITREGVGTVVIGIPSYINREEIEYGGEKLGKLIVGARPDIRVDYQNEMFTTKMAQANLIERGVKQVSKHDDEEAARIILDQWLECQD